MFKSFIAAMVTSYHGDPVTMWTNPEQPRSQSTVWHIKPMAKVTMYLATLKTIQEWHSWYDWNTILETLNLSPWTSAIPKCHSYPGRQPYTMITQCPENRGFRTVCNHRQPLGEIQEQLAVSYSVVKQHILLSDMNDRSSNNNLSLVCPRQHHPADRMVPFIRWCGETLLLYVQQSSSVSKMKWNGCVCVCFCLCVRA